MKKMKNNLEIEMEKAKTVSTIKELIAHRKLMLQDIHLRMKINHVTLRSRLKNPMTLTRDESDKLADILEINTGQMECIIRGLEITL